MRADEQRHGDDFPDASCRQLVNGSLEICAGCHPERSFGWEAAVNLANYVKHGFIPGSGSAVRHDQDTRIRVRLVRVAGGLASDRASGQQKHREVSSIHRYLLITELS
jgi:hypothetical protein